MSETEEEAKREGQRAAYLNIMLECGRRIGIDDPVAEAAEWIDERERVKISLKALCSRFGLASDWSDNLDVADIIEKYIEPELAEVLEEAES